MSAGAIVSTLSDGYAGVKHNANKRRKKGSLKLAGSQERTK